MVIVLIYLFYFFLFFPSRESGALGSRLTGAGWGGCAVSLVPEDLLETFLEKVKSKYYLTNLERANKVEESLFASRPGGGAFICKIKEH